MGSDSKQPAARLTDVDTGHPPAVPTPIITGSTNVFTNGLPAAREGDKLVPHHPGIRLISEGSASVLINGKRAARVTDAINCGGVIITGSSNVLIGNQPGRVRNLRLQAELSEYIRESMKPENMMLEPHEETQLEADIAVKYRGLEGAIATWHDFFMRNGPAGDMNDPAKAEGLRRAESEKNGVSEIYGSLKIEELPAAPASPKYAPISIDTSTLQPKFDGLWSESFPDGKSMEHGGTLVRGKDGAVSIINTGSGTSGSFMPDLTVGNDETLMGVFHTHPYDAGEGGYTGVSLSGGDAAYMINNEQNLIIAQSGEEQFMYLRTLETPSSVDAVALNDAQNNRISELMDMGYEFDAASKKAAVETAKEYGLAYYEGTKGILNRVNP